jgi:hypothetical protein
MTVARSLTIKQRRFVRTYVETGNGTQAAVIAYDTDDPHTAHSIASENLRKPAIQVAVAELLDANGLSDRKLAELHAHYLGLAYSDDVQEKALGLKALDMAYKLKGAYRSPDVQDGFADYLAALTRAYQRRLDSRPAASSAPEADPQ